MEMKVKKLSETAKLPDRAYDDDLGYDIFSDENIIIPSGEYMTLSTGISILSGSKKYGFVIKDRSSVACKGLFTHAGILDGGYTGEVKVLFHNANLHPFKIYRGDKIAQLIPTEIVTFDIEEVDSLVITERGNDGFGSTGK